MWCLLGRHTWDITASKFILWNADPSPVPHWLNIVGLQSSLTLSKSHRVIFLLPSHPKSLFLNKDYGLFLPQHPDSIVTLQE